MKKILRFTTALIALVLAFALIGCVSPYNYENANTYVKGGTTLSNSESVNEIEIDWVNGDVLVEYGNVEEISFSESANNLTDAYQLRYKNENGKLSIKFCKSGADSMKAGDKSLYVVLPDALRLSELSINTVSAEISVKSIRATSIEAESVSGDISISNCTANEAEVETTSGDIVISGEIYDLGVQTVSGDVDCDVSLAQDVEIDSTSGSVDINLTGSMPLSLGVQTVSGDVLMTLIPADFAVKYETVSGTFYCQYPTTTNGNVYTYGDTDNVFEIKTVSGDLKIYENN